MDSQSNYLLGRGERLTEDVAGTRGGGEKESAYTFSEAKNRLAPMLSQAATDIEKLPEDACPNDQAIISLILHPEWIAKSYFPSNLIRSAMMEVVGSRPKEIKPEKKSLDREPIEATTTEIFVQGPRAAIRKWSNELPHWSDNMGGADELKAIEKITTPTPQSKIKGTLPETGEVAMEIVFHDNKSNNNFNVLDKFKAFLEARELSTNIGRYIQAQGLIFVKLKAPVEYANDIAVFSIVRALRKMPKLRTLNPIIRSSGKNITGINFPDDPPISPHTRIAIFDGGIPNNHPITKWVTPYEFPDMHPPNPKLIEHGTNVTSAALFGSIDPQKPLPKPYAKIDHYRVLDESSSEEMHEVLERIDSVLESKSYDFVNLSIGPHKPIEDDEIDSWTATLDDRFARSPTLAMVAVGNDGESDSKTSLDRIQIPADCVNALAVGSCDTNGKNWKRAPYSSVGPGRSPGLIKPDVVDFGGSDISPFIFLNSNHSPSLVGGTGTSYAAPNAVRTASGIRAYFGGNLNDIAIRTLLIHTAEKSNDDHFKIGRGRVAQNLDDIVVCDDDEIRVVYQGEISPSKYIRARIPMPSGEIYGMVKMKATICFKSETDPHHPGNYTRACIEPVFRPHDQKKKGVSQRHPDTKPFFPSSLGGKTEIELRRDAQKWENCLHAEKQMRGSSLHNPCFDIHYIARSESGMHKSNDKLLYALIVDVRIKSIGDLYNQIVQQYALEIEPLKPIVEVPIRT